MARMGNNCQIPTPEKYVIQMLNLIKYKDNIFEKRVLENSCGEGNILVEIVKRYIKDARKQGKKNEQIIVGLENNIVAYEELIISLILSDGSIQNILTFKSFFNFSIIVVYLSEYNSFILTKLLHLK